MVGRLLVPGRVRAGVGAVVTGVDTDLAVLRELLYGRGLPERERGYAALGRVEAELSRLREELDACEREIDEMDRRRADEWTRAEAAEARCARLEAERNEYAERLQWLRDLREREGSWGKPYERAMASSDPRGGEPYECEEERDQLAERCARLQQALKELRAKVVPSLLAVRGHLDTPYVDDERWTPWTRFVEPCLYRFDEVLDEALAGPDTPPVDELQRRTDEIYAADKAQDYNHMRGDS